MKSDEDEIISAFICAYGRAPTEKELATFKEYLKLCKSEE